MGAVHESIDPALLARLAELLPPARFIETGSYEGNGTLLAQPFFAEIHTIEIDEELYEGVRTRFAGDPGISVHLGSSPEVLRGLVGAGPTVYWLDAHWCADLVQARPLCPLIDELDAIGSLDPSSVVLIDDARLFLSVPAAPHPTDGWPDLEAVLAGLRRLSSEHELQVIDDVLVFASGPVAAGLRDFAHEHARDILSELAAERDGAGPEATPATPAGPPPPPPQPAQEALHGQIEDVQRSLGKISEQIALLQEAQAASPAADPASVRRAEIPTAPAQPPPPGRPVNGWRRPLRELKYRVNRLNRLQHHEPKPMRLPARYGRERAPADPPTISIVTPSFNQGRFIGATVASVLSQDYPALEYVVQDGGSTDETDAALQPWIDRLHHYESAPDGGQAQAINLAFARTGGEVMAYLNSDDLLLPGTLAYVGRYFAEHPEVDAIYGQRVMIDRFGDEIGRWVLPPHDDEILSWVDFVPQETLFWRRSLWDRAGGIDESFRFALDWDMLIRFRSAGARIVRVPRFLGAFRIHDHQKTAALNETDGLPEMAAIRASVHAREVSQREILEAIRPYLRRHVVTDRLYRMRLLRY